MIKSFYFKLHDEKGPEKELIDFIETEPKKLGITKIKLLLLMYKCYKIASKIYNMEELKNDQSM